MSIITNIRKRIGAHFLKREYSHMHRNRKICNLGEAKNIGVIYSLQDEDTYQKVSAYVKHLQDSGKKVKALGYVQSKLLTGQFMPKLAYDFLYPTGLSYNYKPVSVPAKDFIETDFDILIDLSIKNELPLLYITALSKAKFKAGMQSDARTAYLDFMISLEENGTLDELITQIDHYLSILNNKDER